MDSGLVVLGASALSAGYISFKTIRALYIHRFKVPKLKITEEDLPSVSVCIPARNEMHALEQCLEKVLASTYEKLEILVLDDSSTDNTPHIIRSFAHAGVRFIAGTPLPVGWLGKNHALATLADEASGDYILFMDVDAHIEPETISTLVRSALEKKVTMLSVLPRREDSLHASALFGTGRHMWELVLARKKSPPSSSVTWLIKCETLLQLDHGLADYGMSVRPDHHLARILSRHQAYSYMIGTKQLGVSYEKRLHSQIETAERLYYPMLGKSFPTLLVVLFIAMLGLLPWLYLYPEYVPYFVGVLLLQWLSHIVFTLHTYGKKGALLRALLWPYVLTLDSVLLLHSALRYMTKTVLWKGRNVVSSPRTTSVVIDE